MNKFSILLTAGAFLLFTGAANAGTLTSATWEGSFQGDPFTLSTTTTGLSATGSSVGTTATVQVTVDPQLFSTIITGLANVFVSQTISGSAAISVTGGGAAANQGIAGNVNAFLGNDNTGLGLFAVPLTIGVSPSINPFFQTSTVVFPGVLNIAVEVTASAFAWTTGAFTFTGSTVDFGTTVPTPGGGNVQIPDFMAAGANNLTAGGGGTIQLIAPSITRICAGSAAEFPCNGTSQVGTSASVTTLTLNFVPEPGTLLLLGAGLIGLAGVGTRRRA